MTVAGQIDRHRHELTPAERRVAAVVADDPEVVAFGTVAEVARQAGTSGATVVRMATKLGYDGYVGLQAAVQEEMGRRLRPAAERIRQPAAAGSGDALARTLAAELANVAATLESADAAALAATAKLLADTRQRVRVLSGDASHGVAVLFAGELGLLRPGVEMLSGSEVRVARALADVGPTDVLVAIDLARYDRWVLETAARAAKRGARLVVLSDSALSPLAVLAEHAFTVATDAAGPFDSHVGVLALANALIAAVADRLRRSATERLDRVEEAYRESGALVDD